MRPRRDYSNLDEAYRQSQVRINNQHHDYKTQFPLYSNSDHDYAEQRDLATMAEHVDTSGNVDWEREVR